MLRDEYYDLVTALIELFEYGAIEGFVRLCRS